MRHFHETVTDCSLLDLSYIGALYTWWNQREVDLMGKRLVRALVNNDWLRCYLHSSASFDA